MKKCLLTTLVVFTFVLSSALSASAISVSYETTDLTDVPGGKDSWSATFNVSDANFASGEGLQIFFKYGLYEDIQVVSGAANFDLISWDPKVVLGHQEDGLVDGLATASTTDNFSFTVSYNWLGTDVSGMGNFRFEQYASDWQRTGSGTASPTSPVPVPGALVLLGSGLVGLAGILRKKQS